MNDPNVLHDRFGGTLIGNARIAHDGLMLLTTVGSTVHGTNVSEGSGGLGDDRDEMGICIEPSEFVIGLDRFEHFTRRTQPEGVRSGPGDLDLTVYSLRKWAKLAAQGNPSVLYPIFVRDEDVVFATSFGEVLRQIGPTLFVSKEAGRRHLGFMEGQRQRMMGERGSKDVNRPELVERYGFDTKYAGHVVRLGLQGIELMQTGRLKLPMDEKLRDEVVAVRTGKFSLREVDEIAQNLFGMLHRAIDTSALPDKANMKLVNQFLVATYEHAWEWERGER